MYPFPYFVALKIRLTRLTVLYRSRYGRDSFANAYNDPSQLFQKRLQQHQIKKSMAFLNFPM
jgi:hypothetical protein